MTNFCSFFPDGIPFTEYYWGDCCEDHDDDFDYGTMSFSEANDYLWWCVRRKGYKELANIIWYGVTIFGYPFFWIARRK